MKRLFLFVMIFILVFAITSSSVSSQGKTTTLTFWTFQQLHKEFMDDAVATWNVANPNKQIQLKSSVYKDDEMANKLLIALQAGVGAPDIADVNINVFPNYLKGTTVSLVPLNDIVEPVLNKVVKSRLDNYFKDGNYYGIPTHVGATVMYYNTEIMDKAGVNIDDIVTWKDYVEAGKKVVAKTGKPMTTVEVLGNWTFQPLISQRGSDIFDKNGKVILDNETNINVLQEIVDWVYKDKIAIPAPGGLHGSEEYWGFMNKGGAASVMMPMWFMGRFVNYMPDLKGKIAIRPLPRWTEGGNRSAGMGGTGTVITIQCKNQELAKEFLSAAKLSREGSIKIWTKLGFDPVRWDVWDAPEMSEPNEFTDYFVNGTEIFNVLLKVKDEINQVNITENYTAAIDLIKSVVAFKALKERSLTPEEVLKQVADELRAME
ncbi:MAG TPA: ABC transporter substrate-binding protein [Atribacterota bacterium]|nr:ABC transporter substrate-binding protein [Atribacterota bacterium]